MLLPLLLLACGGSDADDSAAPATGSSTLECPEDTGYVPALQPSTNYLADERPVVVRSVPQAGDQAVDPALGRVRVVFSEDMSHGGWSWAQADAFSFPEAGDAGFTGAREAWIDVTLEPDTTYVMWVNLDPYLNFKDEDGNPAVPYQLAFHTAPE